MATPWTKFRNLCSYYIDCVKYSEKRQEYLFTDQLNEVFMLPALEVNWHLKEELSVSTNTEQRYIRSVLINAEESDELFIGYPLSSFISPKGFHCLCPVMLFPVHVATLGEGRTTGMRITIDRQGIDINKDWVEFHVPRDQQNYFIRACERTSDEMGSVDVENALQFIANHFKTKMNPNFMDYTLRHSDSVKGLLNTAVLFVGSKTKYTRNLIKELNQIRNEPDDVLDQTALAYVFRDPVKTSVLVNGDNKKIPAVFTRQPLNHNQFVAVETALNNPVTKVTGPPGTGKSHMSVNLIANEVFNGGSVLFTSKNHKAIHAVFEMCQESKPHADFDLVEFCTVPGNDNAEQWDKMKDKLETVYSLVQNIVTQDDNTPEKLPNEVVMSALEVVKEGLDHFRDAEKILELYDKSRVLVSRYARLAEKTDKLLLDIPSDLMHSDAFIELLGQCASAVRELPKVSAFSRFKKFILKFLGKYEDVPGVFNQIRMLSPHLVAAYSSNNSISRKARKVLKLLRFKALLECWQRAECAAVQQEQSICNYDVVKAGLLKAYRDIIAALPDAYVNALCQRIKDIDVGDLISRIQGAMSENPGMPLSFLSRLPGGNRYEKTIELFHVFQKVFPAWAVTMLSLRRASPCLPGVFSLVLIDEASQCEIPPMIPALFRAQRLAVVGDPDQFPPVITMKLKRNDALRRKYGLLNSEMNKYSFCENDVFSVVPVASWQTIKLNEHFRCTDDIAMYFNEEFYKGGLCPCVGDRSDKGYESYGLKPGMLWVDADGGDEVEAQRALQYLRQLRTNGFEGSVGVISPLRKLADQMKTLWYEHKKEMPVGLSEERINTANGFQGGQCDVVVFLLGLNEDRTPGRDLWYITAGENKYIYNVSVSRAKVCFVAVGNRERALKSGLSYIQKLIPGERKPHNPKIGPGEPVLQRALDLAGIKTFSQYPVLGRYLDLAIVDDKVDIEVDGQSWHQDRNGCTKADDIHRDMLLEMNGWVVVRVWHHEVINNIQECVEAVKRGIEKSRARNHARV